MALLQMDTLYELFGGHKVTGEMNETLVEEDWFGRYGPEGVQGLTYDGGGGCGNEATATATKQQPVRRFTLTNRNQMSVQVITYGATITSIKTPDKFKKLDDVVLGFDKLQDYYNHPYYFGCTVGRVANRIGGGKFVLAGKHYQLACNNGGNHLHGGIRGFDKVLWDSHVEGSRVILSYRSRDGEEGYPGEVNARVSFELTPNNELFIRYHAKANKQTPINLTNHSYFNLSGQGVEDIGNHVISINADHYLPKNEKTNLPTGEIRGVDGSLFDLRHGLRLADVFPLLTKDNGGYDHNFCIKEDSSTDDGGRRMVAKVVHLESGRCLEVLSTLPGVQLYTANFLPVDNSLIGKANVIYRRHSGLCLETQYFPDSVNQPRFPNCIFGPGEDFEAVTIFRFSTIQ
ncbi:hypothetical protein CHUAL_006209 [Chamberlinius hualienensis]